MAPARTAPIRIALVDDHRTVLWGLEKLIQTAQPRLEVVATATCRAELFTAIAEHRPDIVLLDLNLGDESGLDLVPAVRERGPKVIILTGLQEADVEQRAIVAGASGFIHKSEPADVILRAIDRVQEGQIWLDRGTTAKVFDSFRNNGNGNITQPDSADSTLTATERKIIAAVTKHKGSPNKTIAAALHISSHTLRNHLASIYEKLGVHKRVDLVFYALENGLDIDSPPRPFRNSTRLEQR